MKAIKIGLEHRWVFQAMTPKRVKMVVLGLMDAAEGKFAKGITRDILPTFMELRKQLGNNGEVGTREGRNEEDKGFEAVFKAYEEERVACEEKVKALRRENDTVIKAEDDALKEEDKAIGEERDALEGEYKALARRLKACDGDEDGRRRCMGKFVALERRRKALTRRRKELDGRRKALIERSVDFLADSAMNLQGECYALKEEVELLDEIREAFKEANYVEYRRVMPELTRERLEGVSFVNREEEIIGSKLNDREAFKADAEDDLPPVKDEPVTENKEGHETNTGEYTFTTEAWKVIDENWEELKDAVYRVKVKNEVLPYDSLSNEAWKVLDKYQDELAKLFHI